MLPQIDLRALQFAEPDYLWLLVVPAVLTALWIWRLVIRRADARRMTNARVAPVRARFSLVGDLPFWLCVNAAIVLLIVALARPHGPASVVRQGGIDLVILADGSASMRVKDVSGDRWKRAMRFVRTLGDSLSWKDDRVAMALFAHIATPQIRLTKDPNTFFFFLDHLDEQPPFRIEEDTTWDTNLELGVYWGLRVVEKDEEVHGKSPNAKMFVLLSDGEVWSGEVANSLKQVNARHIPIFVVGVGTLAGGAMPQVHAPDGSIIRDPETPTSSRLDRPGLQRVALSTGGQYFELDRDGDRHIANAIIDTGKRLAPSLGVTEEFEDLYWYFLSGAALLVGMALLFLRERPDLWLQATGAAIVAFVVMSLIA